MNALTLAQASTEDHARARETMHEELAGNLLLLQSSAELLEEAEVAVREAFETLQEALQDRATGAKGYNAGVRGLNRLLGGVAEARKAMLDGDIAAAIPLDYVLPEAPDYAQVTWPEEWPQSDLIDPAAFNLSEIVGA